MDNFKAVYKILSALEKAMDCPEFDISQIGTEKLKVSNEGYDAIALNGFQNKNHFVILNRGKVIIKE